MGNLKQRLIKPGRDFNYAEGVKVKNTTGAEIAADKIVYVSGFEGPYLKVALADEGSVTTCSGRLMITKHAIPDGGYGICLPWKLVTGVNTSTGTLGNPLYLDAAGAFRLTTVGVTNIVYVGHILAVDATDGAYLFCGEGANRES